MEQLNDIIAQSQLVIGLAEKLKEQNNRKEANQLYSLCAKLSTLALNHALNTEP